MTENICREIIDHFLEGKLDANTFVNQFMNEWKKGRDENVENDEKFQRLIDRIFTSCDSYSEKPEGQFEINESELREEVGLLRHIWFG